MTKEPSRFAHPGKLLHAAPLVLVIGVLLVTFPGTLYLSGDDFGYVDSLLRTYWSGHYTPSDWLAPTNFTLPWIGSAILHLTGRFWLATLGFSLFCALGLVGVTLAFLKRVGISTTRALLYAAFLLAHPFVFGVQASYTGYPVYLLFIACAAWAWSYESLPGVMLFAVAATLTRQSGIALFVLVAAVPMSSGGTMRWSSFVARRALPASLGVLACVLILGLLPKGWAGKEYGTTAKLFSELSPKGILGSVGIVLVCWAQGTAIGQFLSRRQALRLSKRNLLIGGSIALVLSLVSLGHLASIEPRYHVNWPRKLSLLWHASLVTFLLIDYERLKLSLLSWWGPAVGALLLVRGIVWDFYLIDAFIAFSFTAALTGGAEAAKSTVPQREVTAGVLAVAGATVVLALVDGYTTLVFQRATQGSVTLFEAAQRSGQVAVTDSAMPFGMLGWKLLDKYVADEAHHQEKNCLVCFLGYVSDAHYVVLPDSLYRPAADTGEVVNEVGRTRISRIFTTEFHLVALRTPVGTQPPLVLPETHPIFRKHPMNNAEWDQLVRRGSYERD